MRSKVGPTPLMWDRNISLLASRIAGTDNVMKYALFISVQTTTEWSLQRDTCRSFFVGVGVGCILDRWGMVGVYAFPHPLCLI